MTIDVHEGRSADRIRADASRPDKEPDGTLDLDRVSGILPDGRVGAAYPRTSLDQLLDELPVAARFLQQAAADRATVARVE